MLRNSSARIVQGLLNLTMPNSSSDTALTSRHPISSNATDCIDTHNIVCPRPVSEVVIAVCVLVAAGLGLYGLFKLRQKSKQNEPVTSHRAWNDLERPLRNNLVG